MSNITKCLALCFVFSLIILTIELCNLSGRFASFKNYDDNEKTLQDQNIQDTLLNNEKTLQVKNTLMDTTKASDLAKNLQNLHVASHSNEENKNANLNLNKTLTVSISPGSRIYYALDSVRERLKREVQMSARGIKKVLKHQFKKKIEASQNITRAILTYLPNHMSGYAKEAKALYLSVAIMRLSQPENIKTDIIFFTPADGVAFPESFGCVRKVRRSFDDEERCSVLEHFPMIKRPPGEDGAFDPLKPYSNYIDSIMILSEFEHTSAYDFLMRVDLDTFLTPGFGDWIPSHNTSIVVGTGGYGSSNANAHLKWVIIKRLDLTDSGLEGLGSTWYGRSNVMVATAQTTVTAMRWLHTQEFNEFEICCSGTEGWPNWHWPVILLYGGHVALNQLGAENVQKSEEGKAQMDFVSTSTEPLTNSIKHIHCWHTDDLFSKFEFHAGNYQTLELDNFINMSSSRDYSTVVAVSSERLSGDEMKFYISDQNLMKDKKWIRSSPTLNKDQSAN